MKAKGKKTGLWNIIDKIEGDKVVWIIVFMLTMISALAIFSSTSLLTGANKDRGDLIQGHTVIIGIGYALMIFIYNIKKIKWLSTIASLGFLFSVVPLGLLLADVDWGFLDAQEINHARRTLSFFGFQIHVFEIAKVCMVLYLAWALNAYKEDQDKVKARKKSETLWIANKLAETKHFAFMGKSISKRFFYMYIPMLIVCAMILPGSNSSAFFCGLIMFATLVISGIPLKEIVLGIGFVGIVVGCALGLNVLTAGKIYEGTRVETMFSRLNADYTTDKLIKIENEQGIYTKAWYKERDAIKQPYSAKIAIHEGGLLGKGSGNSTQKYVVTHIYSDYMFSFIVEEYGVWGATLILILFVSLLARGSLIARSCKDEFAKIAVAGLSIMITGQAFMHIAVNVGLMPMTGQTLPLISDGGFAFVMFCIAFGFILSISRIARNEIRKEEEAAAPLYENTDDVQVAMSVLEGIEQDHEI